MRTLLLSGLGALVIGMPALAQDTPIESLTLGMSEAEAGPVLMAACGATERLAMEATRFPIASEQEAHIRCDTVTLADGRRMASAMLTFADDALVMIEARGNAGAMRPEGDPNASVNGYDVFFGQRFAHRAQSDQAWLMRGDAFQAFLLFWDNPAWSSADLTSPAIPFHIPEEIRFGVAFDDIMASLDSVCQFTLVQEIEEIWLGTEPAEQRQIDCFGYEISGYPRKLEFVFGDGQLEQMWVMFGAADIPRLREELTARYGEPIFVDETYEAFDGWRIALRKDIPEILMTSERLPAIWRETRN